MIRFAADAMLGRLARWLRGLGYDVFYRPHIEDDELLALAAREHRILLTRDRKLVQRRRAGRHLLVESTQWREQLRQVVREFDLDTVSHRFSRCMDCNSCLVPVTRQAAEFRVPAHIHRTQQRFYECPRCAKLFWSGDHVARIREVLDQLDDEAPA